jgi:hypothetical protein
MRIIHWLDHGVIEHRADGWWATPYDADGWYGTPTDSDDGLIVTFCEEKGPFETADDAEKSLSG